MAQAELPDRWIRTVDWPNPHNCGQRGACGDAPCNRTAATSRADGFGNFGLSSGREHANLVCIGDLGKAVARCRFGRCTGKVRRDVLRERVPCGRVLSDGKPDKEVGIPRQQALATITDTARLLGGGHCLGEDAIGRFLAQLSGPGARWHTALRPRVRNVVELLEPSGQGKKIPYPAFFANLRFCRTRLPGPCGASATVQWVREAMASPFLSGMHFALLNAGGLCLGGLSKLGCHLADPDVEQMT